MSGAMFLMLKKSSDRRQREALEQAFQRADVNGDGRLSVDEYYTILKDHGVDCNRDEIIQIMQIADKDHDGYISREEFLGQAPPRRSSLGHHHASASTPQQKADRAFGVFDKNHDGYITKDEMLKMSKNLTREQVDAVFARNDDNHDGKLTLEEFREFMSHNQHHHHQQKPPPSPKSHKS